MPKGNLYDQYYQTRDLFGLPYPELIRYFTELPEKGKLLDLGCGQGRNAIPLAEAGFEVTGIDHSKVGVEQMIEVAKARNLKVEGLVEDIYAYEGFADFDYILLDSMFHFAAKDKKKEVGFINYIFQTAKSATTIVICIQDTGKKVETLHELLSENKSVKQNFEQDLVYEFLDQESGHSHKTKYKMVVFQVVS